MKLSIMEHNVKLVSFAEHKEVDHTRSAGSWSVVIAQKTLQIMIFWRSALTKISQVGTTFSLWSMMSPIMRKQELTMLSQNIG